MQSALYRGWVRHRRFAPTQHEFRYPLYMAWLDLEELPAAFDGLAGWSARGPALAWFRRADHFGDVDRPLPEVVRDLLAQSLGRRPAGPVRLLTHLRYFGYCFNPISCYYCYREDGGLDAIVAEVNNTWGRRHCYVLDAEAPDQQDGAWRRWHTAKTLHVSPFMPIDQRYEWRFREPAQQLSLHMASRMDGVGARASENAVAAGPTASGRAAGDAGAGNRARGRLRHGEHSRDVANRGSGAADTPPPMFDATLHLQREALTPASARGVLLRYPLMTLQVIGAIHFEALKLWLKRTPVFPDPHVGDPVKETPEIRP